MQQASSLRDMVNSSWFARLDLLLVILGGAAWILFPEYVNAAPLLLLALPWVLRIAAKEFPFRRTYFDWLILIFFITVWVGYWASYDQVNALNKAWLLTTSVFLYYALSAQPEENLVWITSGLFLIGVGVSVYFFLTYNFIDQPRKIALVNQLGTRWMNIRPQLPWPTIHPNYVAGVAALTGIFGLYPLRKSGQNILARSGILAGFFIILLALAMATSRGIWMALASAVGIWLLWRLINLSGINLRLGKETLFPILVMFFLCVVVTILYLGPARSPSGVGEASVYGIGSRAEVFVRALYFVRDFPFTGGGLAAFPGLYSQYILVIPHFYLINSHNLFLDVFIEQGVFGGIVFFVLSLLSIWFTTRKIAMQQSADFHLFQWLLLSALVIAFVHGMVDDYLYNGKGSILALLLIGLCMMKEGLGLSAAINSKHLLLVLVAIMAFIGITWKQIQAVWYADLGAVQLAKVELKGFPTGDWTDPAILAQLGQADAALRHALELDPKNLTANHRLGLISLLRQDFPAAVFQLEQAHISAPNHRGIIKSLGYGYAWLGDIDNAVSLLKMTPETKDELDPYCFWWREQGRDDLSENGTQVLARLKAVLP